MSPKKNKIAPETWSALILLIVMALGAFWLIQRWEQIFKSPNQVGSEVAEDQISKDNSIEKLWQELFKTVEAEPVFSLFNGAEIKGEFEEKPLAVIVENYAPIRSAQAGLEKASIVYEAPAEGGITRFLALFNGFPVAKIGPIRSARPYLVQWAKEWEAPLTHIGGSEAALKQLNELNLQHLDEDLESDSIWRDENFEKPHNAFTSMANIQTELNPTALKKPHFTFKNPSEISGNISTIAIDFSVPSYEVKYIYNASAQTYDRYNGGKRHHQISPATIAVQLVDYEVLDEEGRLALQIEGTGSALVFRDGEVIQGFWEKQGKGHTQFYDAEGKEVAFNRGQIWIEVVPVDRKIDFY